MAKKAPTKTSVPEEKSTFVVTDHALVAKHEVCSEQEKQEILVRYKASPNQLPRITAKDPAIRHLSCKVGDLIKISRASETSGDAVFFRIVSSE